MPDNSQQKPPRTQADKERSRQQSRAVTGKEAAKGVTGQPGRGQRSSPKGTPQKGTSGPGRGSQAGKGQPRGGGGGSRSSRSGSGASMPRRSPTALLTWGLVALVLIIVVVLVVVKLASSSTNNSNAVTSQPVPAAIAADVTQIPASVYNAVGASSPTVAISPPKAISGAPALTLKGKPGVFYMGGEFCPFCGAERWAMIASFSRFGTFTGLGTMAVELDRRLSQHPDLHLRQGAVHKPLHLRGHEGVLQQPGERRRHRLRRPSATLQVRERPGGQVRHGEVHGGHPQQRAARSRSSTSGTST